MQSDSYPPRLRQAVVVARDLDATAAQLTDRLQLQEPYADPGVGHFGLRNAVFALGDTFLEVVSPVQPDTAAGRLLERRGGDCGYMLMFQLDGLAAARGRAAQLGVREVFEVSVDDMQEVHLHPADMRGAIVSLSRPEPPQAWRWGGPRWQERSAARVVIGATIEVPDSDVVADRWKVILGEAPEELGIRFREGSLGLTEIAVEGLDDAFELAGVRFTPSDYEEE
jgi:hypothetical protein